MYICISIFISFLIQQLYVFNVEHLLVSCIHYLCTSFTCLMWVKLCSSFSGNKMLAHLQEYAHLFFLKMSKTGNMYKWFTGMSISAKIDRFWCCVDRNLFPLFLISSFHSYWVSIVPVHNIIYIPVTLHVIMQFVHLWKVL